MNRSQPPSSSETTARRLGSRFAPLFCGFVRYVMESAAESGAQRVYYFTREGDFFAELHRAIAEADNTRTFPEASLLPVSRLATFAASLREISVSEFNRIWWYFRNQSLRAFLKTLDLSPQKVAEPVRRTGLNPEEPIPDIARDGRVGRMIADPAFRSVVEEHVASKRDLLERFLDDNGITQDTRRATVVDIGWAGSIQSNLAYVRPCTRFDGFYFAVKEPGCALPANVTRRSYLDDILAKDASPRVRYALLRSGPLEMLCNSPLGTVVGYAVEGGRVRPRRVPDERENRTYNAFTRFFQEGVLEHVPKFVCEETTKSAVSRHETARRLLATLLHDPPKAIAKAYLRLHHDDTFGSGTFSVPNSRVSLSSLIEGLFLKRARERLKERLNGMEWPAGALIASNLRPLQWWIVYRKFPEVFCRQRNVYG